MWWSAAWLALARLAGDPNLPEPFRLGEGIVCAEVVGYGDFTERAPGPLQRGEKLRIYLEPEGASARPVDGGFVIHLVLDLTVRRAEGGRAVMTKKKAIEVKERFAEPPAGSFLAVVVETRGLRPGSYWVDLVVLDVATGRRASGRVPFAVQGANESSAPPR